MTTPSNGDCVTGRLLRVILLAILLLFLTSPTFAAELTEASGCCVVDGKLLVVGDDDGGRYYIYKHAADLHGLTVMYDSLLSVTYLRGAALATDLESIDQLADGRIVVLSEDLCSLIGQLAKDSDSCGVLVQYPQWLNEFGNRGIEGLAVKKNGDSSSQIAVLWEGGYPEYISMEPELRKLTRKNPFKPIVLIHDIPAWGVPKQTDPKHRKVITLNVPMPEGVEPDAQRFRGSDLVWYQWPDSTGKMQDGLIVLITSGNAPVNDNSKLRYEFKWLQRFGLNGDPVGEPLDLKPPLEQATEQLSDEMGELFLKAALMQGNYENVNWEGLDWLQYGESLVLVYDTYPLEPPAAFVVQIPDSWKTQKK